MKMDNYSVFFPGYSAGEDAYKEITTVCSPYGKKAVVISDEISINATKKYLDGQSQAQISASNMFCSPVNLHSNMQKNCSSRML